LLTHRHPAVTGRDPSKLQREPGTTKPSASITYGDADRVARSVPLTAVVPGPTARQATITRSAAPLTDRQRSGTVRQRCHAVRHLDCTDPHPTFTDRHLTFIDRHLTFTGHHLTVIDPYLAVIEPNPAGIDLHLAFSGGQLRASDCQAGFILRHLPVTRAFFESTDHLLARTSSAAGRTGNCPTLIVRLLRTTPCASRLTASLLTFIDHHIPRTL
jgi:hypothetical protein